MILETWVVEILCEQSEMYINAIHMAKSTKNPPQVV